MLISSDENLFVTSRDTYKFSLLGVKRSDYNLETRYISSMQEKSLYHFFGTLSHHPFLTVVDLSVPSYSSPHGTAEMNVWERQDRTALQILDQPIL